MSVTLPDGFVWGVAARRAPDRGRQLEQRLVGVRAHARTRRCAEPSGDCCDSFHRYADDIALVRDLGFGAYRFSIEWSRIEPEDGEFSRRRARLLPAHARRRVTSTGVRPVVTFHHFTTPRWVADARRLGRARDRRPLRPLLRAHGRAPRRPHLDRLHDQRAEHRVADGLPHRRVPARACSDFGLVRAR